jgi:hypothetical protein
VSEWSAEGHFRPNCGHESAPVNPLVTPVPHGATRPARRPPRWAAGIPTQLPPASALAWQSAGGFSSRVARYAGLQRDRLTPRDQLAITPLIWDHMNPYGRFELDMDSRIELRRQWVTQEELDAWIVWKDAETTWWEARLYRVTLIGAIAAVMASLFALVAVVQAWWH